MSEQCFGRLMKDGEANRGRFGDNHRFFLEFRCSNKTNEILCNRCNEWKERGVNKKDPYRCHHGLITEAIPEWSHIYDGPWYQSKVAAYGHPSKEEMVRANKAKEEARKGVEGVVEQIAAPQEPKAEKKKPGRKKKETVLSTPPPQEGTQVEKPTSKRRPKKIAEPAAPVPEPAPAPEPAPTPVVAKRTYKKKTAKETASAPTKVDVQAVEASTMLTDVEVVKIVVKPFSHNDTSYFLDSKKNKVYSVGKDKKPLAYIGRWDAQAEHIDTEFPDSDAE